MYHYFLTNIQRPLYIKANRFVEGWSWNILNVFVVWRSLHITTIKWCLQPIVGEDDGIWKTSLVQSTILCIKSWFCFCTSVTSISRWYLVSNLLLRGFLYNLMKLEKSSEFVFRTWWYYQSLLDNWVLRHSEAGSHNLYQSLSGWFLFRNIDFDRS